MLVFRVETTLKKVLSYRAFDGLRIDQAVARAGIQVFMDH